jgi:hypothetical protein
MNKLIKELAIKSGLIVGESNGFDRTMMTPAERRFADLIIQECIAILDIDDGATHHKELLEKHFYAR